MCRSVDDPFAISAIDYFYEVVFNRVVTHIPIRRLRTRWLRLAGATLAPDVVIFCGVQVIEPRGLTIGCRGLIGWRVFLDGRGGITMGDYVNVASDSHILTADHDVRSRYFQERREPVRLGDFTSLGTRTMVLKGVTVGHGGVAAAGAVVNRDVPPFTIVGGVPAKAIGKRATGLAYTLEPPLPLS
jgi:putative colanic acid biosynthesis acetyltransferase WcaF